MRTTPRPAAVAAYAALAVGLLGCALFTVRAAEPDASMTYLMVAALGTAMSCVGAARMRPAGRRIWWALAAGQALFLVGDLLYVLLEEVLGAEPYPSVADIPYLLSYPVLAVGLLWLVRARRPGRQRAAFLDAAILTTALATSGTVFIVSPAVGAPGQSTLERLLAGAYPAMDLLVLALVVTVFATGMLRNASLWALVAGVAAVLVSDISYAVSVVTDDAYPTWVDQTYLLSYLLVGFAAVHPSAGVLSEPNTGRAPRSSMARLAWLGVALILTPTTEFVAGQLAGSTHQGSLVLLVGGCLTAVFVVLRMADLVHQLQQKAVQLSSLARTDGLTGVANRRTWDHELERACAFAQAEGTTLHAAVLDLDHFKRFNDEHGHTVGDLVIRETAAAWRSVVQGRGFLARYGGEEFTVLLPSISVAEAESVLDRMREEVTHDQTCSIGLATWDHAETPSELVGRADEALYRAKRGGRNRIVVSPADRRALVDSAPLPRWRAVAAPEARPAPTAP